MTCLDIHEELMASTQYRYLHENIEDMMEQLLEANVPENILERMKYIADDYVATLMFYAYYVGQWICYNSHHVINMASYMDDKLQNNSSPRCKQYKFRLNNIDYNGFEKSISEYVKSPIALINATENMKKLIQFITLQGKIRMYYMLYKIHGHHF